MLALHVVNNMIYMTHIFRVVRQEHMSVATTKMSCSPETTLLKPAELLESMQAEAKYRRNKNP